MLVQNSFPADIRVKNEADLLVAAGYGVTVVGLRSRQEPAAEVVDRIQVYRIPRWELFAKIPLRGSGLLQRIKVKAASALGYAAEYLYFTSACFLASIYVLWKHGFDVIHAHNPPDSLFVVAAPYKLLGKKYVFDHHDLCPELYRSRYSAGEDLMARLLALIEKANLRLADITIATNESYRSIHLGRGGRSPDSVFVVRNGPNSERMREWAPSQRLRAMNKCILCYVGALNPQDGVDYLLRSLHHLAFVLGRSDFHCVIMGSGDSLESLRALAAELKLGSLVDLAGFVSKADLFANLAAADICVDPDPSSPLNDVSTWIKIMEYMAFSKPIVAFDLKETKFSAGDSAVYARANDEAEFARLIARLMDQPAARSEMGRSGRLRVERDLQWSVQGKNLLQAYQRMFPDGPSPQREVPGASAP